MTSPRSIFKTPELEKQFMDAYEAVLTLWPVPHEAFRIPTHFGETYINVCGPEDKPAMLLLPGFGANSTMWFPNIAALSSQFRVYALDTVGQPGKSLPNPDQPARASNSNEWIKEVMDGLGLDKAFFGGVSLGGWLALNFTIHFPERVNRVALLDPAASLEKMSSTFFWHSLIPFMVYPTRSGLINYFRWMSKGYKVNPKWGELMLLGTLNTRPQPPIRAAMFSDPELRSVKVPVMILIGGQSVIYDPQRACQRAKDLIPGVLVEIIPDSSHMLNAEKAELVNETILEFCRS